MPDRLLAEKFSVEGLAAVLKGGRVPVNQLLLAEISESTLEVRRLGRVPVNKLPPIRSVSSTVEGMRARVPLNELFRNDTKVKFVADAQLGCVPSQRLLLSSRYLRLLGTISVQLDPILLLLTSK